MAGSSPFGPRGRAVIDSSEVSQGAQPADASAPDESPVTDEGDSQQTGEAVPLPSEATQAPAIRRTVRPAPDAPLQNSASDFSARMTPPVAPVAPGAKPVLPFQAGFDPRVQPEDALNPVNAPLVRDFERKQAQVDQEYARQQQEYQGEQARYQGEQKKFELTKANADFEEQARKTGARTYRDGNGVVQHATDDQGRPLYHATPFDHPGDDSVPAGVLQRRNQFGEVEQVQAPLRPSNDLADPNLYFDYGNGKMEKAGHVDDMALSKDPVIAGAAKSWQAARTKAIIAQGGKPLVDAEQNAKLAVIQGKQQLDQLSQQSAAVNQQLSAISPESLSETEGGFLGIGAKPTAAALQAQTKKAALDAQSQNLQDQMSKLSGQLSDKAGFEGELVHAHQSATLDLQAYQIQEKQAQWGGASARRAAALQAQGKDPEKDDIYTQLRAKEQAFGADASQVAQQQAVLAKARQDRVAQEQATADQITTENAKEKVDAISAEKGNLEKDTEQFQADSEAFQKAQSSGGFKTPQDEQAAVDALNQRRQDLLQRASSFDGAASVVGGAVNTAITKAIVQAKQEQAQASELYDLKKQATDTVQGSDAAMAGGADPFSSLATGNFAAKKREAGDAKIAELAKNPAVVELAKAQAFSQGDGDYAKDDHYAKLPRGGGIVLNPNLIAPKVGGEAQPDWRAAINDAVSKGDATPAQGIELTKRYAAAAFEAKAALQDRAIESDGFKAWAVANRPELTTEQNNRTVINGTLGSPVMRSAVDEFLKQTPGFADQTRDVMSRAAASFLPNTIAGLSDLAGSITNNVANWFRSVPKGESQEANPISNLARAVSGIAKQEAGQASDPRLDSSMASKVGANLGTIASFVAPLGEIKAAATAAKLTPLASKMLAYGTEGTLMGSMNASAVREDAKAHGLRDDEAAALAPLGFLIGAGQMALSPVMAWASKLSPEVRAMTVRKFTGDFLKEVGQGVAAGTVQMVSNNAVAQKFYDDHRDLFEGVGEGAKDMGAATGIVATLSGLVGAYRYNRYVAGQKAALDYYGANRVRLQKAYESAASYEENATAKTWAEKPELGKILEGRASAEMALKAEESKGRNADAETLMNLRDDLLQAERLTGGVLLKSADRLAKAKVAEQEVAAMPDYKAPGDPEAKVDPVSGRLAAGALLKVAAGTPLQELTGAEHKALATVQKYEFSDDGGKVPLVRKEARGEAVISDEASGWLKKQAPTAAGLIEMTEAQRLRQINLPEVQFDRNGNAVGGPREQATDPRNQQTSLPGVDGTVEQVAKAHQEAAKAHVEATAKARVKTEKQAKAEGSPVTYIDQSGRSQKTVIPKGAKLSTGDVVETDAHAAQWLAENGVVGARDVTGAPKEAAPAKSPSSVSGSDKSQPKTSPTPEAGPAGAPSVREHVKAADLRKAIDARVSTHDKAKPSLNLDQRYAEGNRDVHAAQFADQVNQAVEKYSAVFGKDVVVDHGASGTGGFKVDRDGRLHVMLGDLGDPANIGSLLKNPSRIEKLIQEEAIHKVALELYPEKKGIEELWRGLGADTQDAIRKVYERSGEKADDFQLGHEFLRMIVQGRLKIEGDRLSFDGKLSEDTVSKGVFDKIREVLSRIYDYFRETASKLRRDGASEAVAKATEDAATAIEQRLREMLGIGDDKGEKTNGSGVPAAPARSVPSDLEGEKINRSWTAFSPESKTLGVPRAEMPQIKSEARGALTQFLKARGVTHTEDEVLPGTLKPTQVEYSPGKVEKARAHVGGDRAILVSSDDHVVDGHHQWMAALTDRPNEPMRVIRLNAPIRDLLPLVHEFPSTETTGGGEPTHNVKIGGAIDGETGPKSALVADSDGRLNTPSKIGLARELGIQPNRIGNLEKVTHKGQIYWVVNVVIDANTAVTSHDYAGTVNADYPQELQPRNRSDRFYRQQQAKMAGNPNLDEEAKVGSPDSGPPIIALVNGKPVTVIGNGRANAKQLMYSEPDFSAAAQGFPAQLGPVAERRGIPASVVKETSNPVLARVIVSPMSMADLRGVSKESNQFAGAETNAIEQAGADADALMPAVLANYDPSFDLMAAKNSAFRSEFVRAAFGEQGANLTEREVERRLQLALFTKAYGNTAEGQAAFLRMAGEQNDGTRNLTNAMFALAPDLAAMKQRIADGSLHDLDISGELSRAAQSIGVALRDRPAGQTVDAALEGLSGQAEMELGETSPLARSLTDFLIRNRKSRVAIEDGLKNYVSAVYAAGDPQQAGLFGDEKVTKEELWSRVSGQEVPVAKVDQVASGSAAIAPVASESPKDEVQPDVGIQDFGEKISGARKDKWKKYEETMGAALPSQDEAITLSKHFPEPDYEAAIEAGASPDNLAMMKALRDIIPAKPRMAYKLRQWGQLVRQMHATMQSMVKDGFKVSPDRINELIGKVGGKIYEKVRLYRELGFPAFTKADGWEVRSGLFSTWDGVSSDRPRSVTYAEKDRRMVDRALESQDTDDKVARAEVVGRLREKLVGEVEAGPEARKTDFSIYQDRKTQGVFIGKKAANGVVRIKEGFKTAGEARAYLNQNRADVEKVWEDMKMPPNLRNAANVPRQGVSRRDGDVTPEAFSDAFGFRGVQFGNYVEGPRRQADLNEAYDALMDMAEALDVPPKALSFDGSLGLAFGARGVGSSKAHYEAGEVVINITKTNGPGSMAHEWFHGLDNYFARLEKSGVTTTKGVDAYATREVGKPENVRQEVWEAFKGIRDVLAKGSFAQRSNRLDATRSKPYYGTTVEKAARAFEIYVTDRLAQNGIINDYLANIYKGAESQIEYEKSAYPHKPEMDAGIRAAFDKLFETIESKPTDRGEMLLSGAADDVGPEDRIQKWKDDIKAIQDGGSMRRAVNFGDVPKVLRDIGLPGYPVQMPPSVVKKAVAVHEIPPLVLRTLHAAMDKPVAVFKSDTVDGSLVVMLDRVDVRGKPIVVILKTDGTVNNYPSHIITSIYGNQDNGRIARWIAEPGRTLFEDKQKSQQWFHSVGLQYPKLGSIADQGEATDNGGPVNRDLSSGRPDAEGQETFDAVLENRTPAELAKANLGLATNIAAKYFTPGNISDHADIVQTARVGLIKAARAYDPAKGAFSAYAGRAIRNELNDRYGAEKRRTQNEVVSLDQPTADGGAVGDAVAAPASNHAAGLEASETAKAVQVAVAVLPRDIREIVQARMGGQSFEEIAGARGISKQAAAQAFARALPVMKKKLSQLGVRGIDPEDAVIMSGQGGSFSDDEQAISDLMDVIGDRTGSADAFDQNMQQADMESGTDKKTVGRPDLANPVKSETGRQFINAVDESRKLEADRQTHEQWRNQAVEMLKKDREGVKRRLLEVAQDPRYNGLSDAVDVKAAQMLVNDLVQRAMTSRDPVAMREAQILTYAYREGGTEQARAMAARRDPFKTPADRHREFLASAMFRPAAGTRREINKAPSPAEKSRVIDSIKKQIEAVKNSPDAGSLPLKKKIADLTVLLGRAQQQRDKTEILLKANAERLVRIEKTLEKMGVTLSDLFQGESYLRLRGAKVLDNYAEKLDERRKQAFRALRKGKTWGEISKATGLRDTDVDKVFEEFREEFMRKNLAKFMGGMKAEDVDVDALSAGPAGGAKVSEAEARAEMEKALGMMGFAKDQKARNERRKGALRPSVQRRPGVAPAKSGNIPDGAEPGTVEHPATAGRPRDDFGNHQLGLGETGGEQPPGGEYPADATGKARVNGGDRQLGLGEDANAITPAVDMTDPVQVAKIARVMQAADGNAFDMVYEYWINSILSGPITHVANFSGSALSAGWDMTIERGMEATINAGLSAIGKGDPLAAQFGEFSHMIRGITPGLARGMRNAINAFDAESSMFYNDVLNQQVEMENVKFGGSGRAAIPGKTGRIIRLPGRGIMFVDELFKGLFGQMQAGAEAYRIGKSEGLTGPALEKRIAGLVNLPGSDAWAKAAERAREYVFQQEPDENTLGGKMQKAVLHFRDNFPGMRYVIPFVRILFNIFTKGVRMSPLGVANLAQRFIRDGLYHWDEGKPLARAYEKPEMVRHIAEQVIAWTALGLLAGMSEGDEDDSKKHILITGSNPFDETKKGQRELAERNGTKPYTIRVGNSRLEYARYEPLSTVLGTTIDMLRTIKQSGRRDQAALYGEAAKSIAGQLTDKTFNKGLGDLFKAIADPTNEGVNYASNLAASFVPNLIRQPMRHIDGFVRETSIAGDRKDFLGRFVQKTAQSALPLPGTNEPRIDLYGKPVEKSGNPVSRMIFPNEAGTLESPNRADAVLSRWNAKNPDQAYAPQSPNRRIIVGGKPYYMNDAEFRKFSEQSGHLATRLLNSMSLNTENPTQEDVDRIRRAFELAHEQTKRAMFAGRVAETATTTKQQQK